jgi:hypothetical protein
MESSMFAADSGSTNKKCPKRSPFIEGFIKTLSSSLGFDAAFNMKVTNKIDDCGEFGPMVDIAMKSMASEMLLTGVLLYKFLTGVLICHYRI